MAANPVHVTVTGAAGQIGYALVHRIATGQLLGPDTPVVLRLLEIEPALPSLEGVVMELDDCAFPLLARHRRHRRPQRPRFDGTSWALLVGSIPRKAGMERGDLLTRQRRDLQAAGRGHQRPRRERRPRAGRRQPVQHELPHRPVERTRRARRPLVRDDPPRREPRQDAARQQGRRAQRVTNVAIWGNHSATQFPDFAERAASTASPPPRSSVTTRGCRAPSSRRCRSAALR